MAANARHAISTVMVIVHFRVPHKAYMGVLHPSGVCVPDDVATSVQGTDIQLRGSLWFTRSAGLYLRQPGKDRDKHLPCHIPGLYRSSSGQHPVFTTHQEFKHRCER